MSEKKFFIDTEGNDDAAYVEALKKASEISEQDPDIKRVVVLINTKANTGWFERILGTTGVKNLFKGTTIQGLKPNYKFETKKTYKPGYSKSEIVIICGWDSEEVFPIDDYYSAKYIIAIPWTKGALEKWAKTWAASELRGNSLEPFPEPSCIVKKALEGLTSSVNMSTALSHTSDVNLAKTYVMALKEYNEELDTDLINAYLVTNLGWGADQSRQFTDLVEKANTGRPLSGGDKSSMDFHYKQWKDRCGNP